MTTENYKELKNNRYYTFHCISWTGLIPQIKTIHCTKDKISQKKLYAWLFLTRHEAIGHEITAYNEKIADLQARVQALKDLPAMLIEGE